MRDITPEHLRCATTFSCPAVLEITPEALQCEIAASCPAVFEVTPEALQCGGSLSSCPGVFETAAEPRMLLIIGKKPSAEQMAKIEGRVGEDEYAIVIGAEYFANLGGA
jgi:hypothetical protein